MGIRFSEPETLRLPLGDTDYILIKRKLSHGEREDMMGRMLPTVTPGESVHVQSNVVRTGKVLAYLVGWSVSEPIGPDLPHEMRVDTLRNLDPDAFDEIEQAIDAHLAQEAASKNGQRAMTAFAQTSTSVA